MGTSGISLRNRWQLKVALGILFLGIIYAAVASFTSARGVECGDFNNKDGEQVTNWLLFLTAFAVAFHVLITAGGISLTQSSKFSDSLVPAAISLFTLGLFIIALAAIERKSAVEFVLPATSANPYGCKKDDKGALDWSTIGFGVGIVLVSLFCFTYVRNFVGRGGDSNYI